MANQAALTAETIAGLRRATGRDHYSSESDDTIQKTTNRGGKLKRKAEYVHERQLDRPNGPRTYKRRITHAGYQRTILKRNPKRYDEDGDELEDDDVDEEADADAARRDPYSHIRIEELLAPLTSASDLPTHPSLSMPYRSKTLTTMTDQACSMLHRERKALHSVKNLLTKFRGDESYITCGAFDSELDPLIFSTEPVYQNLMTANLHIRTADNSRENTLTGKLLASLPQGNHRQSFSGSVNGHQYTTPENPTEMMGPRPQCAAQGDQITQDQTEVSAIPVMGEAATSALDVVPEYGQAATAVGNNASRDNMPDTGRTAVGQATTDQTKAIDIDNDSGRTQQPPNELLNPAVSESLVGTDVTVHESGETALPSPESLKEKDEVEADATENMPAVEEQPEDALQADISMVDGTSHEENKNESQPPPHRMTTRAQAQAASDNSASTRTRSASPASWVPPVIHPLYQIPVFAQPDRDLGLPAHEAEETRRILVAYVQKQEEVVRGAAKLYNGLLRADRMRQTVFKWCKADGHVGEMSDGEDWYDKEYWGLEEDLRKGHDDEEEDVTTQGKKTRKTRGQ